MKFYAHQCFYRWCTNLFFFNAIKTLNKKFNLKNTFKIINLTVKINYKCSNIKKRLQIEVEGEGSWRKISWRSIRGMIMIGHIYNHLLILLSFLFFILLPLSWPLEHQLIIQPTPQWLMMVDSC